MRTLTKTDEEMMVSTLVTSDIDSTGVALVTLNRPEKLNTMTGDLLEQAHKVFSALAENPAVKVVILTGAGRGFCAGGDLAEGPGGAVTGSLRGASAAARLRGYMETAELLHSMSAVTISAINGACAGAGLSWACATDLRFAADRARFNAAFRGAGLSGDFGGTWTLPRIIGIGRAREKYLLSEPFDAQEALRIGLVSKVWPAEQLLERVRAVAEDLAASAPVALRLMKQNLVESEYVGFERALDNEAVRHSRCAETQDAAEAARAFLEKRPAVFVGE
ncbi:enoyl-CoA hydratase/isomerase family protein [Streptomyces sp. 110]|uniref:Enoyl-CoA hydratase/isomerase family protein n=1 Tax=Streptomyces endocoffeicus TaxID=2898945 RepID=A0ABS1PKJ2_9ACTN|nr:enoyl-CoA hydratase-related protein [Streptomyces endocoffeicus]MBL1112925.1 enoyl-CoA hydratase/isomerase family protein [Streptomyces endocoffeicus]